MDGEASPGVCAPHLQGTEEATEALLGDCIDTAGTALGGMAKEKKGANGAQVEVLYEKLREKPCITRRMQGFFPIFAGAKQEQPHYGRKNRSIELHKTKRVTKRKALVRILRKNASREKDGRET